MTDTTSAGDEVELPEPDIFAWLVETDDSYEAMTDPGWTEASVRTYADARAARAVEQERARVVAWLRADETGATLGGGHAFDHKEMDGWYASATLADSIERGDHLGEA